MRIGIVVFSLQMASSELYMPSSGELRFSGPIPLGSTAAFPAYGSERPSTNSSRFGRMSHNSFFVRHAPHPKVVRHIKGRRPSKTRYMYCCYRGVMLVVSSV